MKERQVEDKAFYGKLLTKNKNEKRLLTEKVREEEVVVVEEPL